MDRHIAVIDMKAFYASVECGIGDGSDFQCGIGDGSDFQNSLKK